MPPALLRNSAKRFADRFGALAAAAGKIAERDDADQPLLPLCSNAPMTASRSAGVSGTPLNSRVRQEFLRPRLTLDLGPGSKLRAP